MAKRRPFGNVRRLPSWQPPSALPLPMRDALHAGHTTFHTAGDADAWLTTVRADIARERYVRPHRAPSHPASTGQGTADVRGVRRRVVARGADTEMAHRFGNAPASCTQASSSAISCPSSGSCRLDQITTTVIREWWKALPTDRRTGATRMPMRCSEPSWGSAVEDDLLDANAATMKGAGQTKRNRGVEPDTALELEAIAAAMPDPYRMTVSSWRSTRRWRLDGLDRRFDGSPGVVDRREPFGRLPASRMQRDAAIAAAEAGFRLLVRDEPLDHGWRLVGFNSRRERMPPPRARCPRLCVPRTAGPGCAPGPWARRGKRTR